MTAHRHIYRQKRTAVLILLAAVLICAAVCRRSGGEETEPEREKGLTAYVLRADTAIYMEFGVRNEFLRVLHGGELSGELLLSARSGDTVVSARRAYSTAERVTDTSSLEHTVLPEGEKARYIRVQIGKQGFASIFEIEVYGRE